ncbi:hypothetical protein I4U23_012247 [Adineta vaga]|nr:hypothetical protein I4U23_012247 [Adineta vaga]
MGSCCARYCCCRCPSCSRCICCPCFSQCSCHEKQPSTANPVEKPPEELNEVHTISTSNQSPIPPKSLQVSRAPTPEPDGETSSSSEDQPSSPPKTRPPERYNKIGITTEDPLLLIKGFEKKPLVSLEEALHIFQGRIPNLDDQIKEAKEKCYFPSKHNLTHDESAALYLYLLIGDDDSVRSHLQNAWTSNNRKQMKPWFLYLRLLKNGLDKLPDVKVEVWQGIGFNEEMKNMLESNSLSMYTCMSLASPSSDQVKNDLREQSNGKMILVGFDSVGGKDVTNYVPKSISDPKKDDKKDKKRETLLWPGTKVNRVGLMVFDGNGCLIAHLKAKPNDPPSTPRIVENSVPIEVPKSKPKQKHFTCPLSKDPYAYFTRYERQQCQNRCSGRHAENHCNGFDRIFHACSHHCEPVDFSCSRCSKHIEKRTLRSLAKAPQNL